MCNPCDSSLENQSRKEKQNPRKKLDPTHYIVDGERPAREATVKNSKHKMQTLTLDALFISACLGCGSSPK